MYNLRNYFKYEPIFIKRHIIYDSFLINCTILILQCKHLIIFIYFILLCFQSKTFGALLILIMLIKHINPIKVLGCQQIRYLHGMWYLTIFYIFFPEEEAVGVHYFQRSLPSDQEFSRSSINFSHEDHVNDLVGLHLVDYCSVLLLFYSSVQTFIILNLPQRKFHQIAILCESLNYFILIQR